MKIAINKPCHEDWDKMTPNEKGAFCKVCTKDVIDFSKKTLEEIKAFFSQPMKEKVCGRFREDQLDELSFDSFYNKFSGFLLPKKVMLVVALSVAFWLSGENTAKAQSGHKMGKVAPVSTTTVTPVKNQEEHVKGKIKVTPKDTTKTNAPKIEKMKMGEVAIPPKKKEAPKKPKPKKSETVVLLKGDVNIEEPETK